LHLLDLTLRPQRLPGSPDESAAVMKLAFPSRRGGQSAGHGGDWMRRMPSGRGDRHVDASGKALD
jgi:hypothetical protein